MRYPESHKAAVRDRIVRTAARLLRRLGPEGLSIPGLMREVGLTHGGFYNHFADRDALLAEAIDAASREGAFRDAERPFEDSVATYLSTDHVAHPEMGCIVAAIGASAARDTPSVRAAVAKTARGFLALLERRRRGPEASARMAKPSDETLRIASQMIGAVTLARVVDDPALARRLLKTARQDVLGES